MSPKRISDRAGSGLQLTANSYVSSLTLLVKAVDGSLQSAKCSISIAIDQLRLGSATSNTSFDDRNPEAFDPPNQKSLT